MNTFLSFTTPGVNNQAQPSIRTTDPELQKFRWLLQIKMAKHIYFDPAKIPRLTTQNMKNLLNRQDVLEVTSFPTSVAGRKKDRNHV